VIKSPLHLKTYVFTKLSVTADSPHEGAKRDAAMTTHTKVETARNNTDKNNWRVGLQISCVPAEKDAVSYRIEAELIGIFQMDGDFPEEKAVDIVSANAPSVLYSAAREMILLITGRGPFRPFCLPSVTFIDHAPSVRKKSEETKAVAAV